MYRSLIAIPALLVSAGALAEPACRDELPVVQREVGSAGLSDTKKLQMQSLLEQAAKACKNDDQVVAMAGIDQVRAMLAEAKKAGGG